MLCQKIGTLKTHRRVFIKNSFQEYPVYGCSVGALIFSAEWCTTILGRTEAYFREGAFVCLLVCLFFSVPHSSNCAHFLTSIIGFLLVFHFFLFFPLLSCFFVFISKRSCHRDYHLFDLQNRNGIAQLLSGADLHKQHGETVMELPVLD